jgi:hypothetical protein
MGRAIISGFAGRGFDSADFHPKRVKEAAAFLRAQALTLSPEELGFDSETNPAVSGSAVCGPTLHGPTLYGVVIDMASTRRVLSLTVLSDGSVSLCGSGGFACAGVAHDPDTRWKCADLLQYAERFVPLAAPTQDLGIPQFGDARFYFLTQDGPRIIETRMEDLSRIDERLGVLYFAAKRVITAVEHMSDTQQHAFALDASANGSDPLADDFDADVFDIEEEDPQCWSAGNAAYRWRI